MASTEEIARVAQAIRDACNEVIPAESNDEVWLRLASAAIGAMDD